MKIRFIQNLGTKRGLFRAGYDYELPNDEANHYVQSGIATKAPEAAGHGDPVVNLDPNPQTSPEARAAAEAFNDPGCAENKLPLSSGNPPPITTTAVPKTAARRSAHPTPPDAADVKAAEPAKK